MKQCFPHSIIQDVCISYQGFLSSSGKKKTNLCQQVNGFQMKITDNGAEQSNRPRSEDTASSLLQAYLWSFSIDISGIEKLLDNVNILACLYTGESRQHYDRVSCLVLFVHTDKSRVQQKTDYFKVTVRYGVVEGCVTLSWESNTLNYIFPMFRWERFATTIQKNTARFHFHPHISETKLHVHETAAWQFSEKKICDLKFWFIYLMLDLHHDKKYFTFMAAASLIFCSWQMNCADVECIFDCGIIFLGWFIKNVSFSKII